MEEEEEETSSHNSPQSQYSFNEIIYYEKRVILVARLPRGGAKEKDKKPEDSHQEIELIIHPPMDAWREESIGTTGEVG